MSLLCLGIHILGKRGSAEGKVAGYQDMSLTQGLQDTSPIYGLMYLMVVNVHPRIIGKQYVWKVHIRINLIFLQGMVFGLLLSDFTISWGR